MQTILHFFFQECILFRAGAMGCIVDGIVFQQVSGKVFQILKAILFTGIHFHQVKTADEYIRPEPGNDVFDSFVRAAADEDALALMMNEQVLFMQETIIRLRIAACFRQAKGRNRKRALQIVAGKEGKTMRQGREIACVAEAGMTPEALVDADEFTFSIIVISECQLGDKNRGIWIEFQERFDAAAVIIMTMG